MSVHNFDCVCTVQYHLIRFLYMPVPDVESWCIVFLVMTSMVMTMLPLKLHNLYRNFFTMISAAVIRIVKSMPNARQPNGKNKLSNVSISGSDISNT